jgi:hypothetical protein
MPEVELAGALELAELAGNPGLLDAALVAFEPVLFAVFDALFFLAEPLPLASV